MVCGGSTIWSSSLSHGLFPLLYPNPNPNPNPLRFVLNVIANLDWASFWDEIKKAADEAEKEEKEKEEAENPADGG